MGMGLAWLSSLLDSQCSYAQKCRNEEYDRQIFVVMLGKRRRSFSSFHNYVLSR